jgi:hypothetical protein
MLSALERVVDLIRETVNFLDGLSLIFEVLSFLFDVLSFLFQILSFLEIF